MRPPRSTWPDTENSRGILFFAQQMRELLSPSSFESFRALSLDGPTRLREAIIVADDVQAGHLPKPALEPMLQELVWSFGFDTTIRAIMVDELKAVKATISDKSSSLTTIKEHLLHCERTISPQYKQVTEQNIISHFNEPDSRVSLRVSTGIYCSHLLNVGYSRAFVSDTIEEAFFSGPVHRTGRGTLSHFFKRLDAVPRKFSIYVALNPRLSHHMRNLDFSVVRSTRALPSHVQADLQKQPLKYNADFIADKVDALDPYSAQMVVNRTIQNIKSLALAADYGDDFDWDRRMYISPVRSAYGKFYDTYDVVHYRSRRSSVSSPRPRSLRGAREYSRKILSSFDMTSVRKLMRSIDMAVSSESSSEMENRLVSYWSAIETLVSNPDATGPRIAHYMNVISPAICLRYPRRIFSACFDDLSISYRRRVSRIVAECAINGPDQHTAFTALLLLPEFQKQRDDLKLVLERNPLALHRLWKLIDDFGTPHAFRTSISSHEERVRWQIGRIYRARNGIVHAGARSPFIDSITLNMIEYFRTIVGAIVSRGSGEVRGSNSDQILSAMGIEYRSNLIRLQELGKAVWTRESLLPLVRP